jgi:GWxTD domain-containing protein
MTRNASLLLVCSLACGAFAQKKATLDAVVESKRFHTPGQGEQLDIHISVLGNTAVWATNERGLRQPHVQALTLVERGSEIVDFRKSDVLGPERNDTLTSDFQVDEHFLLPNGEYTLTIELVDVLGPADNQTQWRGPLVLPALPSGVSFSDLMLTAGKRSDEKGNAIPLPFAGTYYPTDVSKLGFYTEVYGTDGTFGTDSLFSLSYQIETYETKLVKGQFERTIRVKGASVVPIAAEIPLDQLPSGNYLLAVEVADRQGEVLARQEQFFQRNNPLRYDMNALENVAINNTFADVFTDRDTLAEHVACLSPIANDLERRMINDRWKDKNLELMKRFFYTFWVNRDGFDPERAWKKYHEQVVLANKMYGCRNQKGYENDRGIAFLKYGLPSTVVDASQDNKQLPYIIWHYYKAGRYSDKRLVFWQQNMGIGCWELMHSEIPGELKNNRWQSILSAPLGPAGQSDGTRSYSFEGQRVEDNFLRPH